MAKARPNSNITTFIKSLMLNLNFLIISSGKVKFTQSLSCSHTTTILVVCPLRLTITLTSVLMAHCQFSLSAHTHTLSLCLKPLLFRTVRRGFYQLGSVHLPPPPLEKRAQPRLGSPESRLASLQNLPSLPLPLSTPVYDSRRAGILF